MFKKFLMLVFAVFILIVFVTQILLKINSSEFNKTVIQFKKCNISKYQLKKNYYLFKNDFYNTNSFDPDSSDLHQWLENYINKLYFIEDGLVNNYEKIDNIVKNIHCMEYLVVGQENGLFYKNVILSKNKKVFFTNSSRPNYLSNDINPKEIFDKSNKAKLRNYEKQILEKTNIKINQSVYNCINSNKWIDSVYRIMPSLAIDDTILFHFKINDKWEEVSINKFSTHFFCRPSFMVNKNSNLRDMIEVYVLDIFKHNEFLTQHSNDQFEQDKINYLYNIVYNLYLEHNIYNQVKISEDELFGFYNNSIETFYEDTLCDVTIFLFNDLSRANDFFLKYRNYDFSSMTWHSGISSDFHMDIDNVTLSKYSQNQGFYTPILNHIFNHEKMKMSNIRRIGASYVIFIKTKAYGKRSKPYDEARDELHVRLKQKKGNEIYKAILDQLKNKYTITVNNKIYNLEFYE